MSRPFSFLLSPKSYHDTHPFRTEINSQRFGEDSVEKMVAWTLENVPPSTDPRILEIGSGNGTLLFALHEAGYASACLSGLDYSPDAVKLARMVAGARNDGSEGIAFHVCDFLSEESPSPPARPPAASPASAPGRSDVDDALVGRWDLLLDKGTYDAIALGEKDASGRSPVAAYPARAARSLKENGYLLVTCKPTTVIGPSC